MDKKFKKFISITSYLQNGRRLYCLIIYGSKRFSKSPFKDESELENVVASFYEVIFGEHSLYLPQRSIATSSGVGSIPDLVIINLRDKLWYIVEVELAEHGTWTHIVPQVTKEIVAADNQATKSILIKAIIDEVEKSEELKHKFFELSIPEIKIQQIIEDIMEKSPIIAIPIDGIPADLQDWADSLGRDIKILEVEKYTSKEGELIFKLPENIFTPDEESEEEEDRGKIITESEFLASCEEPGKVLFKQLKALANTKKHELKPRTKAFGYYVITKTKKFCPITIWSKTVTILKYNLNPNNGISPEASAAFLSEVSRISKLSDRFERLKEPYFSTREGDLTEDDVDRFISSFKKLLDSISV